MADAQPGNRSLNELYLGDGAISYDQAAGVVGQSTPGSYIQSFPKYITGATFLSFRHYFSSRFAMGFTAGLDDQRGDLSYGKNSYSSANSGYYTRHVYTGAIEALLVYREHYTAKVYGYVGAGYTSSKIMFHFFDNSFYGSPNSLFLYNDTKVDFSHFNFQFTPLGYRTGKALAAFIELGFGYKGIVHGGISYGFGRHYPTAVSLMNDATTGMLLIPPDMPVDSTLRPLGEITTYREKHRHADPLNVRVNHLADMARAEQANAFSVKEIVGKDKLTDYDMKGDAYHTDNIDALKAKVVAQREKKYPSGNWAWLIVYRQPFYIKQFTVPLTINGITRQVEANTTCIFKMNEEGRTEIGKGRNAETVNIRFGHRYYLRMANSKEPSFERVDTTDGEIESSAVEKIMTYDADGVTMLSFHGVEKQRGAATELDSNKDVVFLPGDYNESANWLYKGIVRAGRVANSHDHSLNTQLKRIARSALADDANVVEIISYTRLDGKDCYWLKGKVWHVNNIDSVRAAVDAERKDEAADENHVSIVIYRDDHGAPGFLNKGRELKLNGAYGTVIKDNTRYVFSVPGDGKMQLALSRNAIINIDAKRGHTYYFKVTAARKEYRIEQVGQVQGAFESSIVQSSEQRNINYDNKPDE